MLQKWIDRGVAYCIGHSMLVIAAALLLAAMSAIYTARHFAIDTDINNLISGAATLAPEVKLHVPESLSAGGRTHSRRRRGGARPRPPRPRPGRCRRRWRSGRIFSALCGISSTVRFSVATVFCFFRRIRWRISPNSSATHSRSYPAWCGIELAWPSASAGRYSGLCQTRLRQFRRHGAAVKPCSRHRWWVLHRAVRWNSPGARWCAAIPRPLDLHRFVEVRPVLDQTALEPGGKATAAIRDNRFATWAASQVRRRGQP